MSTLPISASPILAAAICGHNKHIYTLPRPARHANIMMHYRLDDEDIKEYGFLLENSQFVNRARGMDAALINDQLKSTVDKTTVGSELNTDMLW